MQFIEQVLENLAGKKYFSFLDGYQIKIALEDKEKIIFTYPLGTFSYSFLPFGLCNAPTTFQQAIISIFLDIFSDYMEIYKDDFTIYGAIF